MFLIACDEYSEHHLGFTKLEHIKHEGKLTVLTRYDPTTYYNGPKGATGLEYDLVTLFARRLDVEIEFVFPETFEEILELIATGQADIAAAGLTITPERQKRMRFAQPYQVITEQVIYRYGQKRPKKPLELNNGILEVVKGTSHESTLNVLKNRYADLNWLVNEELDTDSLLYLVNEGLIDYTIADSQQAAIMRNFYPELGVAFDIAEPQKLAWALSYSKDHSLYKEVVAFFNEIKQNNTLHELLEKHYGSSNRLNYVGNCTFRRHIKERLPTYQAYFKEAAIKYELDWRLLAAIGYQESHWDRNAASPTGVKGIMMLTRATARQLKVKDRTDPHQSIFGGARYFKQRIKKIPKHILPPDRIWFALASYNVGFGHLEDARKLAQRLGRNPDKWIDIKKTLPLLSKKKWYSKTKHGYARGWEPVHYVENIRSYYKLMVFLSEDDFIELNTMHNIAKEDALETHPILEIDNPAM